MSGRPSGSKGGEEMTPEEFKQAIEEFKVIYKEVFSIELNDEDATVKAQSILQLFECLTQGTEREVK
ncbi:MAG: hypothetical protein UT44_C0015G0004 [Candidatus Levybacteria bacterium GW2011_GWA1_39_32]|nr:MAG: hypothetical protein UT44_C0015G0004 [Candidatus Levybacteria bacterium GW2011_GWA1_39_32]